MTLFDNLRDALRREKAVKQAQRDNGRLGEIIVENWLRQTCQANIVALPQGRGTKLQLLPGGGKRPDFAVEVEGGVFFVDVKLHSTGGLQEFSLGQPEINEFRLAMMAFDISVLFIALLPREAVDRLYFIELSEIEESNEHGPAGIFHLRDDDTQRLMGPISKAAFDRAVYEYREEGFDGDVPDFS